MIINEKILQNKEVLERFSYYRICEIKKDKKLELRTYLRKFSFDEIGYTYEDFLKDDYYKSFKEKRFMYLFHKKGNVAISEYCEKNHLKQDLLQPILCRGISLNCKYIIENPILLEFLEYDIDIKDFEVKFYENHVELYGNKEKLKQFAVDHNLKYPVRKEPLLNQYHLAFSGVLFLYLKNIFFKEK